jgi:lysylphosphatidylglycerol synthetase-like protein (DUF2156 family)
MAAVVRDPAPRLVSPVLLILAGLCFLLPFAGVSCNTSPVRTEVRSLLAGEGSLISDTAVGPCLDGLNGENVATYSGLELATGGSPSVTAPDPAGCVALSAANGGSTTTPLEGGRIGVGVQPLLLAALVVMLLGLLLGLARFALRPLAVAATAVAAIVLLAVNQAQIGSPILARITQSAFGAVTASLPARGSPGMVSYLQVEISSSFTVTAGLGFILAMVALGLLALYNLAAELARHAGRGAGSAPPTSYAGSGPSPGP